MAMTKEVLRRRGVIAATQVRAPGPKLDAGDQRELEVMLAELGDLLKLPAA
jgi:4-hydroxy-tetrahydrodipicolinate synthase